jgi:hypothetical protein
MAECTANNVRFPTQQTFSRRSEFDPLQTFGYCLLSTPAGFNP